MAGLGEAGRAGHGKTWPVRAWQGEARQARRGKAGLGTTRLGSAWLSTIRRFIVAGTGTRQITPLEMAQNAARAVLRHADHTERDEFGAFLDRAGDRAFASAQLAGAMALVSIAESLARIADDFGYLVDDGGQPYRPTDDVPVGGGEDSPL
jgi:hypothetical protein